MYKDEGALEFGDTAYDGGTFGVIGVVCKENEVLVEGENDTVYVIEGGKVGGKGIFYLFDKGS